MQPLDATARSAVFGRLEVVAEGVAFFIRWLIQFELILGELDQRSSQPCVKFARSAMATLICSRMPG